MLCMQVAGNGESNQRISPEIHVLLVDDDEEYAAMATRLLEHQDSSMSVTTAGSALAALETLASDSAGGDPDIDAIVTDYSMPGMDGLTLLDTVRSEHPDLPVILLTGHGSENVASRAISRGADDYIRKATGTDLAELLTNRITNAVERARARSALARREERFEKLITNSPAIISVLAADGTFSYISPSIGEILGYEPAELVGTNAFSKVHPEDREAVWTVFAALVREPDEVRSAQYRYESASGDWQWLEAHGNNLLDVPAVGGIVVNVQDVSERKAHECTLERQNERLDEFTSVVSHDLRNPLNVATGRLALAREEADTEHLAAVARSHDRMEALIEDLLLLAKRGDTVGETHPVGLQEAVERAWETTTAPGATLEPVGLDDSNTLPADPERLDQLLENLFRNAVEHGGPAVTVRVGPLPDGFYVADDGPGIPEETRGRVFEHGYTTGRDGTGFGLSIVNRIAEAHGWSVAVTESETGGARFEITVR